ncbi:MAG TPA: amidohydrolase family protein [Povalibacter sp.]|nr:amidohydrolase family protein [Povalibacter sp.]
MHSNKTIKTLLSLFLACVSCWHISANSQTPSATITAFEHARIIVGDGRSPIENGTLVIEDGVLRQVGSADQVRIPAGARRVDLTGKTVMPTIVDTHVHTSQPREELLADLRRRAYFGVSAALSLGLDTSDVPLQLRQEHLPDAARFESAGRGITAPEPGRSTEPFWVTSEAEARDAVKANVARKVDIIKIWVDSRNGQYKKLSPALYRAVIDEAHKNNLRVTVHVFELVDAKDLLRAGIDAFAHGVRDRDVDEEFLRLVKERPDFVLGPNLPSRGVKSDLAWLHGILPAPELAALEERNVDQPDAQARFGIQARNLVQMSNAGVRLVLGTDGNSPWAPHAEMEDMVAAGLTPMQVIVAATRNGAQFLKLSDTGSLAPGLRADFIVLDANPLDDITNTRRISSVYLNGLEVDRKSYPASTTH